MLPTYELDGAQLTADADQVPVLGDPLLNVGLPAAQWGTAPAAPAEYDGAGSHPAVYGIDQATVIAKFQELGIPVTPDSLELAKSFSFFEIAQMLPGTTLRGDDATPADTVTIPPDIPRRNDLTSLLIPDQLWGTRVVYARGVNESTEASVDAQPNANAPDDVTRREPMLSSTTSTTLGAGKTVTIGGVKMSQTTAVIAALVLLALLFAITR